ncbi:hypothetical protein [Salinarimonas sp.]
MQVFFKRRERAEERPEEARARRLREVAALIEEIKAPRPLAVSGQRT